MKFFNKEKEDITEEEIISLVEESTESGVLNPDEKEMIQNIFELSDKEASNIMTPRANILSIPSDIGIKEALDFAIEVKKSRIPVYEDNIDHIVGILNFRDLVIAYLDGNKHSVDEFIREAMFIPETKKIDILFKEMQQSKQQLSVVVDEYGQTQGIVAMEDILEEIVGNIQDEYDDEIDPIQPSRNEDEYIVDGTMRLEELEDQLGIDFGENEVETLNGYMISRLEHIPEDGEHFVIDVGEYSFGIQSVENHCIKSVLVKHIDYGGDN